MHVNMVYCFNGHHNENIQKFKFLNLHKKTTMPETNSGLVLGVVHIDNITNDHHNYFFYHCSSVDR